MPQIGAFEAKNTLGSLLDRVEQGEDIVITRHGKPVARLTPCGPDIDRAAVAAALARMSARSRSLTDQPVDWQTLKEDRDTGRP